MRQKPAASLFVYADIRAASHELIELVHQLVKIRRLVMPFFGVYPYIVRLAAAGAPALARVIVPVIPAGIFSFRLTLLRPHSLPLNAPLFLGTAAFAQVSAS